jgi:hypothetical protein
MPQTQRSRWFLSGLLPLQIWMDGMVGRVAQGCETKSATVRFMLAINRETRLRYGGNPQVKKQLSWTMRMRIYNPKKIKIDRVPLPGGQPREGAEI